MEDRKFFEKKYAAYPDVLTTAELQDMLGGLCNKTVLGLLWRKEIFSYRVGKRYQIPKTCVIDYLMTDGYQLYKEHIEKFHRARELEARAEVDRQRLLAFCCAKRSRREMMLFLGVSSVKLFYRLYLNPLLESGELRKVIPDRSSISTQQYIRAIRVQY